ncbi:hypothetical protein VPH35_069566 [Triticum aestivum]
MSTMAGVQVQAIAIAKSPRLTSGRPDPRPSTPVGFLLRLLNATTAAGSTTMAARAPRCRAVPNPKRSLQAVRGQFMNILVRFYSQEFNILNLQDGLKWAWTMFC